MCTCSRSLFFPLSIYLVPHQRICSCLVRQYADHIQLFFALFSPSRDIYDKRCLSLSLSISGVCLMNDSLAVIYSESDAHVHLRLAQMRIICNNDDNYHVSRRRCWYCRMTSRRWAIGFFITSVPQSPTIASWRRLFASLNTCKFNSVCCGETQASIAATAMQLWILRVRHVAYECKLIGRSYVVALSRRCEQSFFDWLLIGELSS